MTLTDGSNEYERIMTLTVNEPQVEEIIEEIEKEESASEQNTEQIAYEGKT